MNLNLYTDRLLLEAIYLLLCQLLVKIAEIDNDEKAITMNTVANLIADKLILK